MAKAFALLTSDEARIGASVLKAIYRSYTPELRESYGYEGLDATELMPAVDSPEGLRRLVRLGAVHILGVAKRGVAYVGFDFDCTWDEEHGLGVMTHRSRVVRLGGGPTSFLREIADRDARVKSSRRR